MILPKVRDPRFVTIRRGGTLTDTDHQLLALWAASCAEHVLDRFEEWLQAGEETVLEAIERYNEVDCRSTMRLREWLLERRREAGVTTWREPPPVRVRPRSAATLREPGEGKNDVRGDVALHAQQFAHERR